MSSSVQKPKVSTSNIVHTFRCPEALWDELASRVPARCISSAIRSAIRAYIAAIDDRRATSSRSSRDPPRRI